MVSNKINWITFGFPPLTCFQIGWTMLCQIFFDRLCKTSVISITCKKSEDFKGVPPPNTCSPQID